MKQDSETIYEQIDGILYKANEFSTDEQYEEVSNAIFALIEKAWQDGYGDGMRDEAMARQEAEPAEDY